MLHGDGVAEAGEAECEERHVEDAVGAGTETLEELGAIGAEDLIGEVEAELVVTGGDRGVGGEDAALADGVEFGVGGVAEGATGRVLLEEAEGEEGGVAFVHVMDFYLIAELFEDADAAEAEDGFLTEAVVGVSAIELVGEATVPGIVGVNVGVEEIDGDDVAGDTDDVVAPGANHDEAILNGDGGDGAEGLEEIFRGPDDGGFRLLAFEGEMLVEISAAMEQGDRDHGKFHVGGRTKGVTREHAETAGVGGDGGVHGDFHGEVGDAGRTRCRSRQ